MSCIKVKRAFAKASIGTCPGSAADMLAAIPQSTISALTSTQLAELIDAMWAACQRSKALHAREVIAEGSVWDARRECLLELAQ